MSASQGVPTPSIIGHRGLPLRYPDNSLAGILASASVCSMTEIDVRRTVDGHLVLSHDPDLAGVVVADSSWEELARLDIGDGHRPALLREVLGALPDYPLNLEIKAAPGEAGFEFHETVAYEVAAMARPFDLITSFYWPVVAAARRAEPAIPCGLLLGPDGPWSDALELAASAGYQAVCPYWTLALERDIDEAHDRGLEVLVWTVDDPVTAGTLAVRRVDGIITNDPIVIGAALGGAGATDEEA